MSLYGIYCLHSLQANGTGSFNGLPSIAVLCHCSLPSLICQATHQRYRHSSFSQGCKWVIGWNSINAGLPRRTSLGTGLGTNLGLGTTDETSQLDSIICSLFSTSLYPTCTNLWYRLILTGFRTQSSTRLFTTAAEATLTLPPSPFPSAQHMEAGIHWSGYYLHQVIPNY